MAAQDAVSATLTRKDPSWNYIYIMMGFSLTIEGNFVGMVICLAWPYKWLIYGLFCVATVHLFTSNGWFQSKLIGVKNWYEAKPR